MAKCANCSVDATYAYKINDSVVINYCVIHLPKFLTAQKNAGLLKPEPEVVENPAPKAKKKTTSVTTPVVEEAAVADATS
jgi:hypothetical protein